MTVTQALGLLPGAPLTWRAEKAKMATTAEMAATVEMAATAAESES